MIQLNGKLLQERIEQSFLAIGVDPDSARHGARSMVQTSLRGVDSHGINLFPHYHRSYRSGRLNKAPAFQFTQHKQATAILDADHALGHHSGIVAMNRCMEMASTSGIGAVTVKNSSHYGASSYFGLHAATQGYIGMAFTNADALVKAFNGRESFFGTNPICFCAPLRDEDPFCLDMATSTVSWNKIKNYRRENEPLPEGWAYDGEGRGVTDPHAARSLSPSGSYKGFGLGMMVEIFCAMLSGSVMDKDMLAMFTSPPEAQRQVSHFFMAIDIGSFIDPVQFTGRLTDMVHRLRQESPLGTDPVMAPGDPEKRTYGIRVTEGIPVLKDVFDEYLDIDPEFEKAIL